MTRLQCISQGILKAIGAITQRTTRLILAESRIIDEKEGAIAQGSGTFIKSDLH
ncbi:MAG TPA: hypothetical protein VHO70_02115 [Chitinispirillaceae bacterium]|nr:hypothetical protein [Chitinispirillaceae bacterium]